MTARRVAAVTAVAVGGALLGASPALALEPPAGSPFISEFHYDNGGDDANERIEVTAAPGTDLTGWTLVGVNGSNGSNYDTQTLSGVVGDSGVLVVDFAGLQNGAPDGIALVAPDGTVVQFLSYEGTLTGTFGDQSVDSTDVGVSETGSSRADGSIQLVDGAWVVTDTNTFGAVNAVVEPTDPEPTDPEPVDCATDGLTAITDVQGTGDESPLVGETVTVAGVVTSSPEGFGSVYVQDPAAAPGAASTAVNVFGSTEGLEIGDAVQVTGEVAEYQGLTQVTADTVDVCAEDAALPDPVAVDWAGTTAAQREALEGVRISLSGPYTVTEVYNLNRFGEIMLNPGDEPLRQATDVVEPGQAAIDYEAANAARVLLLDDGRSTNLANAGIEPSYGALEDAVRVGDQVASFGDVPYVLDYRYDAWRAQPATVVTAETAGAATFDDANPRTDVPEQVGGDVQVASFNVLNYFTTFGGEARGAEDAAELAEQEAKIVAAINALGAEVVALEEIENSVKFGEDRDEALAALTAALNAAAGEERWAFVPSPAVLPPVEDQDVIRNAFIYQPAAVELVGESVVDTDEVWAGLARQPLAQTFRADGEEFTVVVNHFKSKGSAPEGDEDTGDGQGNANATRVAEAQRLAAFVESLESAPENVLLIGDFNSYTMEDPLDVLVAEGYTNLGARTGESTYVFSGRVGSLDHAFASPALLEDVTGVDIWNINSVESYGYQYDGYPGWYDDDPFRSSDHDPILVGLDLGEEGAGGGGGEDDGTTELQLLGINDFHGRLDDAVALAGTIEQQRARDDVDATVLLSAGDNIGASPFVSASQQDAPTIEVLNEMGLDASAVGNHEFDRGFADLTGRVGVDGESGLADFDYLGANVYGTDGDPVLPGYELVEAAGVTVGVIGVVTQETSSLVSPAGIEGITFGDPVEAVNRVTDELTDGVGDEAEVIVLVAHEGAPEGEATSTLEAELAADTAFAAIVNGVDADVDAIFTGHTHQTYAWQAPVPGTDETRPVIQTGSYAADLGRIVLSYDESTDEVTASTVENLALTEVPEDDLVAAYPRVAEVAETVAAAQAAADELGSVVVGSVTADITRAFTTGPQGGQVEDRGSYSALGGLVADSYVYGAADSAIEPADLGLVNPGGLRADLLYGEDGEITLAEANDVTPFANDLVVVSLTGAQLVQVLEQQWQPEGSSRPFLALGTSEELTWSYDPEAAPGERIIVDSIRVSGEPIDLDATYRVATNSFLASGGDNFTTFAEGTTEQTGLIDFDSFQGYLEEFSPLSPEEFTGRVTVGDASEQPQQPAAEVAVSPSTFAPGDLVTFSVSGFGPAERVQVTVDGRPLGRVTTDAEGAATVRVRVPGSVDTGTVEVTATGVTSGSTATVEVQVTDEAEPVDPGTLLQKLASWLRQLLGTWLR
ncbi:ExeM/NucH family extracellular endonuclease [Modestobacter sp. VKM Ac-2977]|uniref:ExeM/NucH family extracellular endonuclease n=1 Tax=Modestobacter sp. VKM Ac-2977 TaxID=3004131 RepID=UPI0022AABB90|nr:ExeM/NucH family extracellular endonuclease [Modestobacter sp. VKM Ac-2977]MCZ2822705.1 ExeM/NucH family extracellular endonuclease [Modestobacter sp. VKM Ac-2977]